MEKYHPLRIFSINNPGQENLKKELEKRKNGYGTIKTNLAINPMRNEEKMNITYHLFMVPIPEINQLLLEIQKNSKKIKEKVCKLPRVASEHFFLRMLFDEIRSTNNVEGVKTTRLEIKKAIENAEEDSKKKVRLSSFVNMYLKIKKGEKLKISEVSDIRKYYNFLLEGEIDKRDLPDGKYFRNDSVRIGTKTKTYYLPPDNEADIIERLNKWIVFINRKDIEPLIKSTIAHYYFESIHPFYDGNGRLGRYIFCSYIGKKLDPYTAVSFSHEIEKKRSGYYKAFKITNNEKNYGEVTFFVISIFKYLLDGQKNVIERLEGSENRLRYVSNKLKKNNDISENEKSILFVYFQAYLFNDITDGIEDNLVKNIMKKSRKAIPSTKTRRMLDKLTEMGYLDYMKKRPLTRKVSAMSIDKFIES